MAKKTVPFQGTKEQEEKLLEMIRAHKGEKGALMPILQQAQDIYGYLPIEVQKIISDTNGADLRCCDILCTVCAAAEREISYLRLSGDRMLCKRFRPDLRQITGSTPDPGWRVYSGWQILIGSLPLHRRLWLGTSYDSQWRSSWTSNC